MRTLRSLFLAGLVLACSHTSFAQQTVDYASVGGRVVDPTGAVVPGATVTARHIPTNIVATTTTDEAGRFRFPYLRIGPYAIAASHEGFTDAGRQLTLAAGSAFDLTLPVSVGGLDTSVTVSGEATTLETARSQITTTLPEEEVQQIPLNGRNFLELALLAPGAAPAAIPSTQLFPETSAVPGISLSVGSQRNLSNSFIVDGLSANDDAAGLSGMTYGVDAIEQFQIVTSGGQAELGRALGGYVSVVTRSGTNRLRGTGYGFFRDDNLNAKNALSGTKPPMNQAQYGASLGGPVVRDRTFYFANVEQRRLDQSGLITISPSNVAAINRRLTAVGYQGPPVSTGVYANPVDSTNLLAKVDHHFSGRDQLSVRYSLYDVSSTNARGAGGLTAASGSSSLDNLDQSLAIGNTLTLSNSTVLETRAQVAQGSLEAPPSDLLGPSVSIAGVASFGRLSFSPTGRYNRMYQLVNNLSHQAGAHAVRAGADLLYNDDRIEFPRAVRGTYTFSSLSNFLAGIYNNSGFTQTFGVTEITQTNPNVGIYLQDEWKVTDGVTANLGLRYDLQFLDTIETDSNNIAPRAGLVWSPFASGHTVVRGSAGLFYDRVPLRALANALMSAGNTTDPANLRQISISLSPTQAGAPTFPNTIPSVVPTVTLPSLTTMDRSIENASSTQASLEIEQRIDGRLTVSAGYHYLRGRDLLMSINQNVPTCVASGTNNGCRPNPAYANNSRYSSAGESNYHGLHLSLVQRPAAWGHYRISYALSKSRNNLGEFFFSSPIDSTDLSKDWGRADNDQRHRLTVNAAANLPHRLQLSATMQAYSAGPFNITSGLTTIQGTTARPIVDGAFIERNAGVGTRFFTLSARLSRTFPVTDGVGVEAMIEGFNLTNHRNVVTRNTNFGPGAYPSNPSASFGQITSVGEPRAFQLGLRVTF